MKFILDKIYQNNYFWILLVIITIVYPFYFIQFGIDFTDTFFHFNAVEQFRNTKIFNSSMTFLSTYIMYLWSSVFGNTILSYRFLNILLSVSTLFLPVLYFRKQLNIKTFLIYSFVVSVSFIATLKSNIGYDTISDFFILNAFFSFLLYIYDGNLKVLILSSFFISLAVSSRLPDVLLLPLFVFILFLLSIFKIQSWRSFFLSTFCIFICFVFFNFLIATFFFGSINNYFESFNSDNLNSTYSIRFLLLKYVSSIIVIFKILIFLILAYILFNFKFFNDKSTKIKNIIIAVILLSYFIIFHYQSTYFYSLSWTFSAILLLFSYFIVISKNIILKDKILVILFLFISILPAMGSNMGLLKAMPMYLIPFILAKHQLKQKYFITLLFFVIVIFSILERFNNTYDDKPYKELNYTFNNKLLKGIKSSKNRVEGLNEVENQVKIIKKNKENHIEFFGMNSHVYNAITGINSLVSYSFERSFNNEIELSLFDNFLEKNKQKKIYFIVYKFEKHHKEFESSKFVKLMNKYEYTVLNFEEFLIFKPKDN